jgi:hypothetical protein
MNEFSAPEGAQLGVAPAACVEIISTASLGIVAYPFAG